MFFIYEQGLRTVTPVDRLLQSREVVPVAAVSSAKPVSSDGPSSIDKRDVVYSTYQKSNSPDQHRDNASKIVTADQLMSSPVITASVTETLDKVWNLFAHKAVHHLPLLDVNQQLQGIVSDRDILRFAANHNRQNGGVEIGQVMSRSVVTAARETEVRIMAEVMIGKSIGAIPIVDNIGTIVGIVTRSDILKTLVHRAPLELWA